jgi:serine/threonine protein kinase/Flp pilus assembly protein TadD
MSQVLPEDGSADALMGVIADEFLERIRRGEKPDVEEYARRYPPLATVFRQMLPALHAMHVSTPDHPRAGPLGTPPIEPEGNLGDFRIVREIGRGGMGVVYEAVQISLGRHVALKVLPFAAALDARQLQRFKNEAQAAAHLHHAHIVPVYAVGNERGVHYYAMQLIEGQTMAALIQALRQLAGLEPDATQRLEAARTPEGGDPSSFTLLPATWAAGELSTVNSPRKATVFDTLARLAMQAAQALEHAHGLGIVHRDIKPANLLIDVQRHLWVTDFGLARIQTDARLTMTGDMVGTLRYMSPEQALGQLVGVDHRSDVYSLGATLYELLTLEPAFNGPDRQELLRQIAFEEPRAPRRVNRAIPVELETIVLKSMAKNADERYATAQEFASDLERFLKDEPILARRRTLLQRARSWARRHRPVVWSAAVGLFVALAVLAGSVGWIVRDRAARQAKVAGDLRVALTEAYRLRGEGKWLQAQLAARQAETLLSDAGAGPDLVGEVQDLLRDLADQEADARLLASLDEMRLLQAEVDAKESRFVLERALPDYRQAFRAYGLSAEALTPGEAAERIRRRPAAVQATMMAALDHWLILARFRKAPETGWLTEVLARADTDTWRQRVRAARGRNDRQALVQLAKEVNVAEQPAEALFVLNISLRQRGAWKAAVELLRRAQEAFPGDFWINHDLGLALQACQPPQDEESLRYLTAAAALRPGSPGVHLNLGRVLWKTGRFDEAAAAYRKAAHLKPDYFMAHYNLGLLRCEQGHLVDAATALRRAVALQPHHAEAHCNLGLVLRRQGAFAQALEALQRGHELGSRRKGWPHPSAEWVEECRQMAASERRGNR